MRQDIRCAERVINPNIANFEDSELRICVNLQQFGIRFGVCREIDRTPLALAEYTFSPSDRTFSEKVEDLLREEKLLDPSFHYGRRIFSVQESKSTLVPQKLYEAEHGKGYLEALFQLNGRECLTLESEENTASYILSAFNAQYLKAAQTIYWQESSSIGFCSIYNYLINEAFRLRRTFKRFPLHVVLHTRASEFDLVVVNDGGLLFINTFPYPDFDNLLYYFLYALNKLKLDLGSVALYLCGTAEQDNLLLKLERQVYNATYLPAPSEARFPQKMPYDRYFCCL